MIGYDRLGSNGRFGNQLFQYAALRGIADKHGYDWCIPPESQSSQSNYAIHDAFKLNHLTEANIGFINKDVSSRAYYSFENLCALNPETRNVTESSYRFDEDMFNNFEDNTNLDGYLQSYKYFEHIEEKIRSEFEFKDEILNPCKEFISQFDKIIFLHIRRGDASRNPTRYPPMTLEYLNEALDHFDKDTYVFVSSDDVEWCKNQDFLKDDRFLIRDEVEKYQHVSKEGDGEYHQSCVPHTDLCLMSLCNGAILSRSTFAWWGAWLQKSENKVIISPEPYNFVSLGLDSSDVVPDSWIKLSKGVIG